MVPGTRRICGFSLVDIHLLFSFATSTVLGFLCCALCGISEQYAKTASYALDLVLIVRCLTRARSIGSRGLERSITSSFQARCVPQTNRLDILAALHFQHSWMAATRGPDFRRASNGPISSTMAQILSKLLRGPAGVDRPSDDASCIGTPGVQGTTTINGHVVLAGTCCTVQRNSTIVHPCPY